ncbi:hypothetical protein BH09MYX1_BH09MYX1_46550 [soil metagenome]
MRRVRKATVALAFVCAFAGVAGSAHALVWPDVPERVARALASPDPGARRSGALELRSLSLAQATPLLVIALADSDPEVRLAAADAAMRVRYLPATEAVLPWLGDRDTRLRIKACDVARVLPNPKSIPHLGRARSDNDATVRATAADALGAQASPDAVPPLLGKLDDPSPPVRIRVVRALGRLGDRRAVVPLVGKVQDSVADVRKEVARALGDLGDPRASQALMLQLRDNLQDVRMEAIRSLGRFRAPDAVDVLAPLASDKSPPLRQAAIAALGRIGTGEAIRTLIATLGTGDDSIATLDRTPVRDALVDTGAKAIPDLEKVLAAPPSTAAAISAAWVLGQLHATKQAPSIVAAMRRGTVPISAGLRALGGTRNADAVTVVLEFLVDPSPQVRAEARGAAFELLDPVHPDGRAVEPLSAALKDVRLGPSELVEIVQLLGRTGAPRAAATLSGLVMVKDPALRGAAVDALGALGPALADDALVPLVGDPDGTIRLRAAVALSRAGGAKARDALIAKLDATDETDRFALLLGLGGILARAPSYAATARLAKELDLAAGPERDAVIAALGQAKDPQAARVLLKLKASPDVDDRRTLATALGAQITAEGTSALVAFLDDGDSAVRANAAWSLGNIGDEANGRALVAALAKSSDPDETINGAAALGRIAARLKKPALATEWLCPRIGAGHDYARANALVGLALSGARCGDGSEERRALEDDGSDDVRLAAALAITAATKDDADRHALDACTAHDRVAEVARRCSATYVPTTETLPVVVFVLGDVGIDAVARAPYALLLADGMLRVGLADRRGALFEPAAPRGALSLRRPSTVSTRSGGSK